MSTMLRPGSIWRHTLHQINVVIVEMATCHATKQSMVVYRALAPSCDGVDIPPYSVWVRPEHDFLKQIMLRRQKRRKFEYVGRVVY